MELTSSSLELPPHLWSYPETHLLGLKLLPCFIIPSGFLYRSGLGSHYGTLSGPIGAFSPVGRPGKEYKTPGKNVITNPGKHGTGFG